MRVTKVIREYVEREIDKKFQPQIDEIGKDYQEKRESFERAVAAFKVRASEELGKIAAEYGFTYSPGYGFGEPIEIRTRWYKDTEIEAENARTRRELTTKRNHAIEEILLNLELGETTKDELRGAIEAVEV